MSWICILIEHRRTSSTSCETYANCTGNPSHVWGQYSPFFPVPSEIDPSVPEGCEISFAQILSRHGARYPTAHKTEVYNETIGRIQSSVTKYAKGFEFIADYIYDLGADDLTTFGRNELVDSGTAFYRRYQQLADQSDPFIRAAGSDRVVESGQRFTAGFYAAQGKSGKEQIEDILVVPETDGFNNTMNHGSCPAFEEGPDSEVGDDAQKTWMNIFVPPIAERLNTKLPGANLSLEETIYMMDLCPYNTVASPNATLSEFCKLFSADEWRSYDYFESLDKWYGYGSGNPLGPSQGVGYVNELIARLTGQPVEDNTTTNSTLDSSPETFPLNKTLYADFSHDNTMISIYAALGLYNATENLPTEYKIPPLKTHGFSSAWTVPFAGRMYVEKMQCSGAKYADDDGELVRILVNERVVPLQNCGADNLGRCKLEAFVRSLSFARSGGLWHTCFT